jgi:hypothetical protein
MTGLEQARELLKAKGAPEYQAEYEEVVDEIIGMYERLDRDFNTTRDEHRRGLVLAGAVKSAASAMRGQKLLIEEYGVEDLWFPEEAVEWLSRSREEIDAIDRQMVQAAAAEMGEGVAVWKLSQRFQAHQARIEDLAL